MTNHHRFKEWLHKTTGHEPYPFQVRFACDPTLFNNPLSGGEGRVRETSGVRVSEITNCDFKLGRSSARRALCLYGAGR